MIPVPFTEPNPFAGLSRRATSVLSVITTTPSGSVSATIRGTASILPMKGWPEAEITGRMSPRTMGLFRVCLLICSAASSP